MNARNGWSFNAAAVVLALAFAVSETPAQTNRTWQYTLLPDSSLTDDCDCGRPTISLSMKGGFRLRLLQENPLFSSYALENISFIAGSTSGPNYRISGQGSYQVGGEVTVRQQMFLEVYIDDGRSNRLCYFTNSMSTVDRLWPMLHISLGQTNGTLLQTYSLELDAAPMRDLWFSTSHSLTS